MKYNNGYVWYLCLRMFAVLIDVSRPLVAEMMRISSGRFGSRGIHWLAEHFIKHIKARHVMVILTFNII